MVKLGFLVNFLSHPVLAGFTSAAAIVIGFSQLKHLLGVDIPRTEYFYEQVLYAAEHLLESNLFSGNYWTGRHSYTALLSNIRFEVTTLGKSGLPESVVVPVSKSGPLVVVLAWYNFCSNLSSLTIGPA